MRNFIIIIVYSLLIIGCKKEYNISTNNIPNKKIKIDTIKLENKNQVIFINPTLSYIDSLKNSYKNKDDFYTMADDANFYIAEAGNYVIKNKIDTINVENNKILKIGGKVISLSKYKPWSLLLYKEGKQLLNIFPIDIKEQFSTYFNGKNETTFRNVDDLLKKLHFNPSNIINKNELDFDKDKNLDYILILQADNGNNRNILFLKKNQNGYSLVSENENVIPCEECGNGAESFYDYKVNSILLSFSSSFKSNEGIYNIEFEFENDGKGIYALNKAVVHKSSMGNSIETNTTLDKNKVGNITINNFNYSNFLSTFVLK